MDYEAVLEQIGGCGKFQLTAFALLSACNFKLGIDTESLVFYGYSPKFTCNDWNDTDSNMSCKIERNGSEDVACTKWTYDDSVFSHSLVTDFDLVCDRAYFVAVNSSLLFAGSVIGMMLGSLADYFGRRKTLLALALWDTIFTVLMAALPGLEAHMVLRFFRAFSAGIYYLGLTYLLEFVTAKHRSNLGSNYTILWCLGYAACAGLGKWLLNWRLLQVASSICCVIYLPYYFLLPESPRWLILNGKKNEAIRIFRKVAKWNGRQVDENIFLDINLARQPSGKVTDMFRSKVMSIKTLTSWFVLWCCACSYMGMALHATLASDDIYLNMALMGLIEIPSSPLSWQICERFGRRISFLVTMIISAICFFIIPFLPQDSFQWIRMIIAAIGKLMLSAANTVGEIWITENFPTSIRNIGLFSCSIWANIAFMTSPYILLSRSTAYWLPEVIFGLQCVAALVAPFFLPETLGAPLLQTVQETDLFRRGEEKLINEKLKRIRANNNSEGIPLKDEEEMSPYPIHNSGSISVSRQKCTE